MLPLLLQLIIINSNNNAIKLLVVEVVPYINYFTIKTTTTSSSVGIIIWLDILFCVPHEKGNHTGLEQHAGGHDDRIVFFLWTIPLTLFLSAATDLQRPSCFHSFSFCLCITVGKIELCLSDLTPPCLKRDEGQLRCYISQHVYSPLFPCVMVLLLRSANSELHCSTTGPQTI